ncbi:hypothetical protein D8T63_13310 [Vibrio vulnificus]|nr:hypothetical protein D8T63_13310 [Vibrio vulnificus]
MWQPNTRKSRHRISIDLLCRQKANNKFKSDSQRLALSLQASLVFMAQCFRFGWKRCSHLNLALVAKR